MRWTLFWGLTVLVGASTAVGQALSFQLPEAGKCPTSSDLFEHREWVEHDQFDQEVFSAYWDLALESVFPENVGVITKDGFDEEYWFGHVSRSTQRREDFESNLNCYVVGIVAIYVESWPPSVDLVGEVVNGREQELQKSGALQLAELRWYDSRDGHRHRWFDMALLDRFGWAGNGSPVPLPGPINALY